MERHGVSKSVGIMCAVVALALLPMPASAGFSSEGHCRATNVYAEAYTWSDSDPDKVISEVTMKDYWGFQYSDSDSDDTDQIEPGDNHKYEAYIDQVYPHPIHGVAYQTWATSTWVFDGEPETAGCESPDISEIIQSQLPQWEKDQIAEIGCSFSTESADYYYSGTIYKDEGSKTLYLDESAGNDLNLTATPVFDEVMALEALPSGAVTTGIQISAVGSQVDGGCTTSLV